MNSDYSYTEPLRRPPDQPNPLGSPFFRLPDSDNNSQKEDKKTDSRLHIRLRLETEWTDLLTLLKLETESHFN